MAKEQHDFSSLSFEDGMAELESLVSRLESRDIGLEDSIAAYERGHALQQYLSEILRKTELRIEKIGQAQAKPAAKRDTETETSSEEGLPF